MIWQFFHWYFLQYVILLFGFFETFGKNNLQLHVKVLQNLKENTYLDSSFNKVAHLQAATLLKMRLQHWLFLVNFIKFYQIFQIFRSSHCWCSVRKSILSNFEKFTEKHQASACNFIKKENLAQVFSCDFREISKDTFFTEHLEETAS